MNQTFSKVNFITDNHILQFPKILRGDNIVNPSIIYQSQKKIQSNISHLKLHLTVFILFLIDFLLVNKIQIKFYFGCDDFLN